MVKRRIIQQNLRGLYDSVSIRSRAHEDYMRTFFTTGRTHGLLLSSLYAPTPRLIFCGNASSLYAAVNLKML